MLSVAPLHYLDSLLKTDEFGLNKNEYIIIILLFLNKNNLIVCGCVTLIQTMCIIKPRPVDTINVRKVCFKCKVYKEQGSGI